MMLLPYRNLQLTADGRSDHALQSRKPELAIGLCEQSDLRSLFHIRPAIPARSARRLGEGQYQPREGPE